MFDKFKSTKRIKKSAQEEINESRIHILNFHKRRFVVGLQWEPVRKSVNIMKEVRRIGKQRNLDVVALRRSDSWQAGFAPKTKHKLRGSYSLIVSLASLLEGCCIAVISLGVGADGNEKFTLIGKTEKGGIHPFSDEIYSLEEIHQTVVDLKSELRGSHSDLTIPVYGDHVAFDWVTDHLDLNELLSPKNLSKDFKLKPLTLGMTKNQLLALAITVVMLIVVALFISQYQDRLAERKRQIIAKEQAKLEEINKNARYQAALDKFKHPWINSPAIKQFIDSCSLLLDNIPLSLEGWIPTTIECESDGMKVNLARPENSAVTTKNVVEAIKKKYGVDTEFFYNQTSIVGFKIKNEVSPNGDDPMQSINDQLVKAISLFQAVNVEASFNPVEIVDVKKNEFGEDLPIQDWQEYTFEVDTIVSPSLIFEKDDFQGMRLYRIMYTFDQTSKTIQYKMKGAIYGAR
ncbi:type 4b pilus protein PilO2 [Enterobacter sp. EC-ML 621]|uniref:type 4b pilus protein PilO2 n=1 Tax=Enterobacter sp. EC-ML 621 TaxID=3037555 RepID=UPI002853A3DA|nr:type 4b pilus protein PilO2 [Enterobacter sp. EC-ML 621]MDR5095805.1 type 4b pilus protein PilO2 [Enterobacter sp. EC-ML 621]